MRRPGVPLESLRVWVRSTRPPFRATCCCCRRVHSFCGLVIVVPPLLQGGRLVTVDSTELLPGDVVVIHPGILPCDLALVRCVGGPGSSFRSSRMHGGRPAGKGQQAGSRQGLAEEADTPLAAAACRLCANTSLSPLHACILQGRGNCG